MKNQFWLAIAAAGLFGLSLLSYSRVVSQGQRFERGQKFLPQLNPDEIHAIEIQQNGETVSLKYDENRFLVANLHDYPANVEAVNRFLKDVLELGLEKEVGKGAELEKELELDAAAKGSIGVVLKNQSGNPMVHFVLGKSTDDGRGRYIKRVDGNENAIYLTSQAPYLTTTVEGFLDKDLLKLKEGQLTQIQGRDFEFAQVDGQLKLQGIPAGKSEKTAETSGIKGLVTGLRFEKVHLADAAEVAGLEFQQVLAAHLDDQSSYLLALAQREGKSFLQIQATFNVSQIQLNADDDKDKLKEKSKILTRSEEVQKFNQFHGSWIYELDEATAGKLKKLKADLLESASKS